VQRRSKRCANNSAKARGNHAARCRADHATGGGHQRTSGSRADDRASGRCEADGRACCRRNDHRTNPAGRARPTSTRRHADLADRR
jgi:hypothetical protein